MLGNISRSLYRMLSAKGERHEVAASMYHLICFLEFEENEMRMLIPVSGK